MADPELTTEQDNIDRWNATSIPFAQHLGFCLVRMLDGQSEMHYTARPEHLNTFDVTHGGASMTLLDVTMAAAARSVAPDMGAVTIEMKSTFMRPARGPLTGRGKLLHRTQSMAFVEATVFDAEGRACTTATGTFKYVRRGPMPPQGKGTLSSD